MAKKKNVDFQKTKLKVGKSIPKRANETSTQFKSKRIIIKDQSVISDSNQMVVLSRSLTANKQFKLLCLNKIYTGYLENYIVDGESINTLARLIIDGEEQVRQSTIRCLKKAITKMINDNQDVTPFITILLTYVKCGLTHIDPGLIDDARDMLTYIIDKCDANCHHQLMLTFLPRLTLDGQVSAQDFELTEKIIKVIKNPVQPIIIHNHETINWNSKENFYDLSKLTTIKPKFHINLSFQLNAEEDIHGTFIDRVTKLVAKELNDLDRRKTPQLRINRKEARKLIASIKMADLLGLKWKHLQDKLKSIIITDETIDIKSVKKAQTESNKLINSLSNLLKL
ncbi:uncharacterized protein LOC128395170 [Panonychus citri]|uniref:uncharacterized protein LOC128395170 n=1 Tax=Panonychus citri TaxID=50023 RepID=UPI0023072540|nr:uncharacterized protein LOC128395170 [Panonychus citri]